MLTAQCYTLVANEGLSISVPSCLAGRPLPRSFPDHTVRQRFAANVLIEELDSQLAQVGKTLAPSDARLIIERILRRITLRLSNL